MSSIRKPRSWLCFMAFAAAFWITFRVMAANGPNHAIQSTAADVEDPALEQMIAHWAKDVNTKKR